MINNIIVTGRLTKDVVLRYTNSQKAVAELNIAVNGMKEGEVDYFKIQVWNKVAENCNNYLTKGSKVGIVGRLKNNNYTDNNGNKRYEQIIVANQVEFLDNKNQNNSNVDVGLQDLDDGDIPF